MDPRDDVSAGILKSVMLKRCHCRPVGVSMGVFPRAPASNFSAGIKEEKPPTLKYRDSSKKIKGFMQLVTEELENERLGGSMLVLKDE